MDNTEQSCEVVYLGMSVIKEGPDGKKMVSQPSSLRPLWSCKREGPSPGGRSPKEQALRAVALNILDAWPHNEYSAAYFYMTVLRDGKLERYGVSWKPSGSGCLRALGIRSIKYEGVGGQPVVRKTVGSLVKLIKATAEKLQTLCQYLAVLAVHDLIPEDQRADMKQAALEAASSNKQEGELSYGKGI